MSADRISASGQGVARRDNSGALPTQRILVVDDDPTIRHLIATVLTRCGHHVDAAADGSAAWNILQQSAYDLLVTDSEMPRVSGGELVKKLRSARMELPVILVSGRMPTRELESLPWLSLAATLEKPFTGDELMASVDQALRGPLGGARVYDPQQARQNSGAGTTEGVGRSGRFGGP